MPHTVLFCLLSILLLAGQSAASCGEMETQRNEWDEASDHLGDIKLAFETIRSGRAPRSLVVNRLFEFRLDNQEAVDRYLGADPPEAPASPIETSSCPYLEDAYLQSRDRLARLQLEVDEFRRHWLVLPDEQRRALQHLLSLWREGADMLIALDDLAVSRAAYAPLRQFGEDWEALIGRWFRQLSAAPPLDPELLQLWKETIRLKSPQDLLPPVQSEDMRQLAQKLNTLGFRLKTVTTLVHNLIIRNQGMAVVLDEPLQLPFHLISEVHWLGPVLVLETLENPAEMFQLAKAQEKLLVIYSGWALELVLLLLSVFLLLRIATLSTRALANLQGRLLHQLGHSETMRVLNGLVWLIKPNAAWILILILSDLLASMAPGDWIIYQLLAPLGVLYALFRALRVLGEWLLARMHARLDQFVSHSVAMEMRSRISHLAAGGAIAWLVLSLLDLAGGGVLAVAVRIGLSIVFWVWVIRLLGVYSPVTERFLAAVLRKIKDPEQASVMAGAGVRIFWPLLVAFAQARDLVLSLHQQLSRFERYQAFSLKLLRMRLETTMASEGEEKSEETETNPVLEKSYRYWMLEREASEQPLIILDQPLAELSAPLEEWFDAGTMTGHLLLYGDHGSGKTQLVKQLARQHEDWPVVWLDVEAKTTQPEQVDALFERLEEELGKSGSPAQPETASLSAGNGTRQQRTLVVIDQTENLFLSQIGHLSGVERFFERLSEPRPELFFLVIMHGRSWAYVNRVFPQEHPFSRTLQMPRWSASNIRKLILSRHHASKRKLQYDDLLVSATAGTESSSFRTADTRVFNLLWELSGGKPELALHLWMGACSYDKHKVTIALPQRPASSILNVLTSEACFVLMSVIRHKALNAEEIRLTTTLSPMTIRQSLETCLREGLIFEDNTRRYRVKPIWYAPVVTLLSRQNMLYG